MSAVEFFKGPDEFWVWARLVMPPEAIAAADAQDQSALSGFFAMDALARAVGWREIAVTESVRDTVQEFAAWWIERNPEHRPIMMSEIEDMRHKINAVIEERDAILARGAT